MFDKKWSKDAIRKALIKRIEESYHARDEGGRFKSIFKSVEPRVKYYKCGAGPHQLDILFYPIGKNDPRIVRGEPGYEVGSPAYVLHLFVHYRVGVNEDQYICLNMTYKKRCPICEYRAELRAGEGSDELIKSLVPKHRTLYNVICYDTIQEEEKGVQVFDVAHWFLERHISTLAQIPSRSGSQASFIPFPDLETGKTIWFERRGTGQTSEFLGHKFLERDYVIDPSVADSVYILDEIISIPTYNELKDAFFGADEKEGSDVVPEVLAEPAEGDEVVTDEPDAPEPPDDQAVAEEIPETPAPPARVAPTRIPKGQPPASPATTPNIPARTGPGAPKPRPTTTVKGETTVCPGGGVFGQDCEKLEFCKECTVWDDCSAESDKLNFDATKQKPPVTAPPPAAGRRPPEHAKPAPTAPPATTTTTTKTRIPIVPRRSPLGKK